MSAKDITVETVPHPQLGSWEVGLRRSLPTRHNKPGYDAGAGTSPGGSAPRVLLIGGTGQTIDTWRPVEKALAAAGYEVVAYASRGIVPSSAPALPWSLEDMVADAVSVLDHLGWHESVTVVGYSLGGFTAELLARTHPGRVAHAVALDVTDEASVAEAFAQADGAVPHVSRFPPIAQFGDALMMAGFREREMILDFFEAVSGVRMNHAYIRPGGVAADLPDEAIPQIRELLRTLPKQLASMSSMLTENPIWIARTKNIGYLDLTGCMALGITGPVLRSTGLPHDLRRSEPYCGYEDYEFDVITDSGCDCYGRYLIRVLEMTQSLRIVEQCLDKLTPGPVMVDDARLGWPADLTVGRDGLGNSRAHIAEIMGESMESLIHHFKLVTEGFAVPAGQVAVSVEAPRGELLVHAVSDGGTRPYRVHFRDPSFTNLQAVAAMCEGGMVSDVIAAVASIDPVMGGVDR